MGNIGLEPEITREFLEKEYRSACETIARLTAENEHLCAVLAGIEASSAECATDNGLSCAVYRWAHITLKPDCGNGHPDWVKQLESAIALVQGVKP